MGFLEDHCSTGYFSAAPMAIADAHMAVASVDPPPLAAAPVDHAPLRLLLWLLLPWIMLPCGCSCGCCSCGGWTTEYTDWLRPLSGEHSIMMEKLSQTGEGEGCTPTHFHAIYHQVQSCGVRAS
jgi:hypothetical protein